MKLNEFYDRLKIIFPDLSEQQMNLFSSLIDDLIFEKVREHENEYNHEHWYSG